MPSCQDCTFRGRRAIRLRTDALEAVVLPGGGHLASFRLDGVDVNPLWEPPWPAVEPADYDPVRHRAYGAGEGRLLSAIAGHNLCLDHFGDLSAAEAAAGGHFHGEAPNLPWTLHDRGASADGAHITYGLECPEAAVRFSRTLRMRVGEPVLTFEEEVVNLSRRDSPIAWQQHVTLGPPFVERGVTRLDLPARRGRTFPRSLGPADALRSDADFEWPAAPGARGGEVRQDVYPAAPGTLSVCGALLEPESGDGFVAAYHPRRGLLLCYAFPVETFPWTALWIENESQTGPPWGGRTTTWGLEFGTTPLPVTRIETLSAGPLFGRRRFAVLPARGTLRVRYHALLQRIPPDWKGVGRVTRSGAAIAIHESGTGRNLAVGIGGATAASREE